MQNPEEQGNYGQQQNLPLVVIDYQNVAMSFSLGKNTFKTLGMKIVIDYFE